MFGIRIAVMKAVATTKPKGDRVMHARFVVLLLCSVASFYQSISAQTNFWKTKDAYLGQPHPSDTPQIFAPGLLADQGTFLMGRVAFSADGKEFYFAQNTSWERGDQAKLKMMRFADHHWGNASVIAEQSLSPTLSIDGNTLYMRKVIPIPDASMRNVWEVHRTANEWSTPIAYLEEPFGVYDFMPTRNGNAYVGSEPDTDDKKNGITYAFSVLTNSGGNVQVKSLGRPLNEQGFNGDLYIAPDESYMIVSAKETESYQSQLYISFHKHDGTWTEPVSLGEKINGGLAHRWGQYVSPDGKYLFYSHGTSEKDCAIYWVRFDKLLAHLRPKDL